MNYKVVCAKDWHAMQERILLHLIASKNAPAGCDTYKAEEYVFMDERLR